MNEINEELGNVHRYTMEKGELIELEWSGKIYKFIRLLQKDTQPVVDNLRDIAEKRIALAKADDVIVHIDKGEVIGRGKKLSVNLYEKPLNTLKLYKATYAIAPKEALMKELRKYHPKVQDATLVSYLNEYLLLIEDEKTSQNMEEQPPDQDFSISKKHDLLVTDQDKEKVTRNLTDMWRKKIDTTIENIRKNVPLSNNQLGATIDVLEKEGTIKKSLKNGKKCYNVTFEIT